MAKLWLVPAQWDGHTVELREERLLLEPEHLRDRFLSTIQGVHSRLLLLFKASMLLDDEAAEACGVDELPFSLGQEGAIRLAAADAFRGDPADTEPIWPLSHCAEAYLHRLIAPAEAAGMTAGIQAEPELEPWIKAMRDWFGQGLHVILLREDGSL